MKLQKKVISLLTGSVLVLSSITVADDTDLYLGRAGGGGGAGDSGVRPNLMFVLDTSGSMAWYDDGAIGSRMTRMRDGLKDVLRNASNVNVGLMRFHTNKGGPVLYPVRYIDDVVEDGSDTEHAVSVRVGSSSDDAEENLNSGEVKLNDDAIEMTQLSASGTPGYGTDRTNNSYISDASVIEINDAEEILASGTIELNSDDLDMGYDIGPKPTMVGTRFRKVKVPKGAKIAYATITFTSQSPNQLTDSRDTNIFIWGEDTGDSKSFGYSNQNISKRDKTSATVTWNGPSEYYQAHEKAVSPNIANIIQEIVDRPDWDDENDLSLLFLADGRRRFYSNNGAKDAGVWSWAPQLKIYFAHPGQTMSSAEVTITARNDNAYQFGNTLRRTRNYVLGPRWSNASPDITWGFRFKNLPVPQGVPILAAEMELTNLYSSYWRDPSHMVFTLEDIADSPDFYATRNTTKIKGRNRVPDGAGDLGVLWRNVPGGEFNEKFTTPDLTDLVQTGINRPDWSAGNSMTIMADNPYDSSVTNQPRVYASPGNPWDVDAPKLRVWYLDTSAPVTGGGGSGTGDQQMVGVRFTNVDIPQGALITEAFLDFTASGDESGDARFDIRAELDGNPATYGDGSSGDPRPSDRTALTGAVEWKSNDNLDPWETGSVYTSPDISEVVQQVVDNPDYCGGNPISFLIEGEGRRSFKSYDTEPTTAPVLRVKYKLEGIGAGEGCTRKTITKQIFSGVDDGEEWLRYHSMSDTSTVLNTVRLAGSATQHSTYGQLVGLRWQNIPIPQNAEIEEARLTVYTRSDNRSEGVNWIIKAQDPGPNHDPAGNFDWVNPLISDRQLTNNSKTWSFNDVWNVDKAPKVSPDLQTVVQEVVNAPGWEYGDPLVLVIDGTGRRDLYSFDGDPASAAKIQISYRANLGDTPEVNTVRTVRDVLIETVDGLSAYGGTPLMDTYWEAARYMTGREVIYGRTRGAGSTFTADDVRPGSWRLSEAHVRPVSHPDSWTGGTISHDVGYYGNCAETPYGGCVTIPSECTLEQPAHPHCRTEYIDGSPTYIAPSVEACSGSHIVLLTDGTPNSAHSHWAGNPEGIPDTLGIGCGAEIPLIDSDGTRPPNGDGGETCGAELATWLKDTDHDTTAAGENGIITHTIGFNLRYDLDVDPNDPNDPNITENARNKKAQEFLLDVATKGGGEMYTANNSSDLVDAFSTILADAIRDEGSFTAPSLAVNSFNQLYNRPTAFLTTFQSDKRAIWDGNVKKFRVCPFVDSSECDFGELIDINTNSAVVTNDGIGQLDPNISDIWDATSTSSALAVTQGGAGGNIRSWQDRVVYTYNEDFSDAGTNLVRMDPVRDMESGDRDGIRLMLGSSGQCESGDDEECLDRLVGFMMGQRTLEESQTISYPTDSSVVAEDNRWGIADSLHSQPVIISYGGHTDVSDEDNDGDTSEQIPLSKVLWGTNDGALHLVDETTGQEEWIFYPQQVLGRMEALESNVATTEHIYGIDSSPVTRTFDNNGDGIIQPEDGDFVHAYFGMRRGGRSIFALDLTPTTTITNTTQRSIVPKLLWSITGGETNGFDLLGQTWSVPQPVLLPIKGANGKIEKKVVLVFGGGHDSNDPDVPSSPADGPAWNHGGNDVGRAIYIVDAQTGQRLWSASQQLGNANAQQPDKILPEMRYSFPSDLTTVDSDSDGYVDRLYGVDLGGQVWRVDLDFDLSDSTAARLATLGHAPDGTTDPVNRTHSRRFFYKPAFAQVSDPDFSEGDGRYDLIAISSGNRADPLDKEVLDRAYLLRDYLVDQDINAAGSNYPACNPVGGCGGGAGGSAGNGAPFSDVDSDSLIDLTTTIINQDTIDDGGSAQLTALRESNGWYIDFNQAAGEKGFATMTIFDGKLFFPTFVPAAEQTGVDETCSVAVGQSYLYSIDVLTAAPVHLDWLGGDEDTLEVGDRIKGLGDGPSGQAVVIRLEEGSGVLTPARELVETVDDRPNTRPPKTFWYQQ